MKNNNFYVAIDYIADLDTKYRQIRKSSSSSSSYYAMLKEYGKVQISKDYYLSLNTEDSVYVVIIKGLFGKTYITSPIYPTENFIYDN